MFVASQFTAAGVQSARRLPVAGISSATVPGAGSSGAAFANLAARQEWETDLTDFQSERLRFIEELEVMDVDFSNFTFNTSSEVNVVHTFGAAGRSKTAGGSVSTYI